MAQSEDGAETVMQGGDEYLTSRPISVGRNLISGQPLSGMAYDFGERIDDIYIDSVSQTATVQLREVTPNGKYLEGQGQLLLLDLQEDRVRWSRPIIYPYGQSGITQDGDCLLYYDGRATSRLDMMNGHPLWEARYSFWYVDLDSTRRFGLGYPPSGGESVSYVDLNTGERVWKRRFPYEHWNDVYRLNDTTVLIFGSGFHQFNLSTGEGWNYAAVTSKRNDRGRRFLSNLLGISSAIFLGTGFYTWGGVNQIQGLYAEPLITDDRIYFSCADRMVALDRNGQLQWERELPKNIASYSELIPSDSVLYLVGRGFAFISGAVSSYGRPFFAAYNQQSGKPIFFNVIDQRKCQIRAIRPVMDSLVFVTEDRIDCRSLQDGLSGREVLIDTAQYGEVIRDVDPERYFRRDARTGKFTHVVGSLDSWGVYTTKRKLLLLDKYQQIAEVLELDSLYYLRDKRDNLSLLRRENISCLVDDNGTLLAEVQTPTTPMWIGTQWFVSVSKGIMRLDIGDIFRQRYRQLGDEPEKLLGQWVRQPENPMVLID